MIRYVVLVSACLMLLGGCSSSPESIPAPESQDSILITYQRSGGFAGVHDQLTVYTNGHCELESNNLEREFTIQSGQVANLKTLIEEANLPGLRDMNPPFNPGADYFEYVISYQAGDGKMHSVRTVSGSVPDALEPVLQELNRIISESS